MDKQSQILKITRSQQGYAEYGYFLSKGIHPRDLKKAVDENILIKIKKGLYRLTDIPASSYRGFIDVSFAVTGGVICLLSALEYHGLTTFNPSVVSLAIRRTSRSPQINFPPVELYRFSHDQYEAGISRIKIGPHTVAIYSAEKTICDCFRYRNKLGADVAKEGLSEYLKLKNSNVDKLLEYAAICRVKPMLDTWLRAMT